MADTTVLIGLDRAECLGSLSVLYARILVPGAVRSEFLNAELPIERRPSPALTTLVETAPFEPCDEYDTPSLLVLQGSGLGPGEAEGIAQAAALAIGTLLTDDLKARTRALRHGIRAVGTARLLARLHRLGLLPDYWAVIRGVRSRGHRISERVASEAFALERGGEED